MTDQKKTQRYLSLTNANPPYKDQRKEITNLAEDYFLALVDDAISPFTREELHSFCEEACPGQPWEQEKIILDLATGRESKSNYRENSADWALQKVRRNLGKNSIIFKNGLYMKGDS